MLKQDYLLRQIESLAMSLAKLFFNTDVVSYEIPEKDSYSETDILYNKLNKLVSEGKINEAENLLFDKVDRSNIEYLRVGIDFYNYQYIFSIVAALKKGFFKANYTCDFPELKLENSDNIEILINFETDIFSK